MARCIASKLPWMSAMTPMRMKASPDVFVFGLRSPVLHATRGRSPQNGAQRAAESGLARRRRGRLRTRGRRHEQIRLVPDEVVLAVDGELVVLAHEDRRHGAGLFAHPAENAARLVNL